MAGTKVLVPSEHQDEAILLDAELTDDVNPSKNTSFLSKKKHIAAIISVAVMVGLVFVAYSSNQASNLDTAADRELAAKKIPLDCMFGMWTMWGACKDMQKARHRRPMHPPLHGGLPCIGSITETAGCPADGDAKKEKDIDCVFGEWKKSHCNAAFGTIVSSRSVEMSATGNGKPCVGALSHFEKCPKQDCLFGMWSMWSECEDKQKKRNRPIMEFPQGGGMSCMGALTELSGCPAEGDAKKEKDVDCVFDEWSAWHCAMGQSIRHRKIKKAATGKKGASCFGLTVMTKKC